MIYNSIWKDEIEKYIKLRQSFGFKTSYTESYLKKFDSFCIQNNIKTRVFTKDDHEKFKLYCMSVCSRTLYAIMNCLKNFIKHMAFTGYNVYIPQDIKIKHKKYVPHIYTKDEIEKYFNAVDTYEYGSSGEIAIMMPVIFRLLYCCAMRISEVLSIKKENIDLQSGVIKLVNTKYYKERYVIVPEHLRVLLTSYAEKVFWQLNDNNYIFSIQKGKHLSSNIVRMYHKEYLFNANIAYYGRHGGPRIHDFRHTSLVYACKQLLDSGMNIHSALPCLSTWAGHTKIESTEYYLRLTAEIYKDIKEKLDKSWETTFKDLEITDEIY